MRFVHLLLSTCLNNLVYNNSIVELNLSSVGIEGKKNRLKAEGVKPLRILLQTNQILSFLDISGNAIWNSGIRYLLQGLRDNKALISLKISKNDLTAEWIPDLFRTLKYTKVSELDISNNPIGIRYFYLLFRQPVKCWYFWWAFQLMRTEILRHFRLKHYRYVTVWFIGSFWDRVFL